MKNATLTLFVLATISIVMIVGCSKNKTSENAGKKDSSVDLQKIESVVKYCADRVLNPLKTNDSIQLDSLNYYLEATANYTHGIASANGELQQIDSNFFTVPLKNNKIAMTDVDSIYTVLIDSIRASFYRISHRNKNLVSTMISTVDKQYDHVTFKATSVILYGNNPQFGGFDTTDYWLWWNQGSNNGGKCGPYSGQTDLDAAIKIMRSVMLRKGTPNGCYVPPFEQVPIEPEDFYNNLNPSGSDCFFKYYLYYNISGWSCYHLCLWPFEMNWYLSGAEHICYDSNTGSEPGARPAGLSFINLYLHGDLIYPMNYSIYLHRGYVNYGTFLANYGNQIPL